MTENHPKETWVKLYESVMTSVVSNARLLERDWKHEVEPVPTFFNRIEGGHHREQHMASLWRTTQGLHQSRKLLRLHRELEPPLGVKEEPTTTAEPPSSEKTGFSRLTPTFIIRDKACLGVTREELAALILIMGVTLPKLETYTYVWGVGGFGLSVDISHTDAAWCIRIFQGLRLVRHAPSMGSGYTTLMAKHLACGSVPFAKTQSWILSVYLTDQVLDALKAGSYVIDKRAFGGDSLEFLRRLPGDKLVDAFYGTEDIEAFGTKFEPGSILHSTGDLAGKWSRAVTEIAFGGLVPQASPNVVSAVKFTVGGSNLNGCVENLELLVDELHRPEKDNALFGENVQKRCRATGHSFVNYTFPSENSNPTDASAIFSRYSNLLERVVALAVGQPREQGKPVHLDAQGSETPGVNERDIFEDAASNIQTVYEAVLDVEPDTSNDSITPPSVATEDLGKALEGVINNIKGKRAVSLSDCTIIIRCVLAAWAFTVPLVEVKQAADSTTVRVGGKIPNEIVLANLPPVLALC
ncbi:hypothetical protein B0J18DRAFT_227910 [Chaetomium sp. MPI-SDFR-AT-0129]|nr:hypothetical protein B0J18DRAFT_227910 [Chaetomium sp. MPI-SDFR-AT-0129]